MSPKWTESYVEDVCDFRAKAVDSNTIAISWNSKSEEHPGEKLARPGHLTPPSKKDLR